MRRFSVILDGKLLTEFKNDSPTDTLEFLATYAGSVTYIILNKQQGEGACAGVELYVLKLHAVGINGKPHVDVSPALAGCMGDSPIVKFDGDVVSVADYELRNNRWVKERRAGRR